MSERQRRYRERMKAKGSAPKTIQIKKETYEKLKRETGSFDEVINALINSKAYNDSDTQPNAIKEGNNYENSK